MAKKKYSVEQIIGKLRAAEIRLAQALDHRAHVAFRQQITSLVARAPRRLAAIGLGCAGCATRSACTKLS